MAELFELNYGFSTAVLIVEAGAKKLVEKINITFIGLRDRYMVVGKFIV